MKLSSTRIKQFQKIILRYHRNQGRRFPWRTTHDPYRILVSEIMLQQTRAERVLKFYRRFLKQFPTIRVLAQAPVHRVLKSWQGLGYNRRVLYLKRMAEIIVRDHGGEVPHEFDKLTALPGVGPYTASAVLAFAWNTPTIFIETNIRTVYLHFFFSHRSKVRDKEILKLVEGTLPNRSRPRSNLSPDVRSDLTKSKVEPFSRSKVRPCLIKEWYSALMDYGAMLKRTQENPNGRSAHYTKQKIFKGSQRELRGAILRKAASKSHITLKEFTERENFSVSAVFSELVAEGFLKKKGRRFRLA